MAELELKIQSDKKLHGESLDRFLKGSIGKAFGKSFIESLLTVMKENNAAALEVGQGWFDSKKMEYEDGDVEVIVNLKLREINTTE